MANAIQAFVTEITANDVSPKDQLGAVREKDGKSYRYVRLHASAIGALTNGRAVVWQDSDDFVVTDDISAGEATNGNNPVGFATGALTLGYYGWVQTYGRHSALDTNGVAIATAGVQVFVIADGVVGAVSAFGQEPAAVTTAASVASEVAAFIQIAKAQ